MQSSTPATRIAITFIILLIILFISGSVIARPHRRPGGVKAGPPGRPSRAISKPVSTPEARSNYDESKLYVHFISKVEDGDSILIDHGETEILIDAGLVTSGVAKYIKKYVDEPIEVMVATHPHVDHIGGLIKVMKTYDIEKIWINGSSYADALPPRARMEIKINKDFNKAVKSEGAEVNIARKGQAIHVGNLTFDIFHPDVFFPYNNPRRLKYVENNNSIVLKLKYGNIAFLFTGDALVEAEQRMLDAKLDVQADILKVGHHGSRNASSLQFLNAVKPKVAVYITGPKQPKDGPKKPHPQTIAALKDVGADVYGVDTHGTVIVATDGETFTVDTER